MRKKLQKVDTRLEPKELLINEQTISPTFNYNLLENRGINHVTSNVSGRLPKVSLCFLDINGISGQNCRKKLNKKNKK